MNNTTREYLKTHKGKLNDQLRIARDLEEGQAKSLSLTRIRISQLESDIADIAESLEE